MKHIRLFAAILLAVSCSVKEAPEAVVPQGFTDQLFAEIEGVQPSESKAYVDDQLRVLWHADDRISVFNKYTYNQEYQFTGQTGDNAGAFNKVEDNSLVTGNALPSLWAVYPYQASNKISNDGVLSVEFPGAQNYVPNSFGRGAGTMVSATDDNRLLFKNACGVLVFRFYGSGVTVNSITLRGNGGEKIAGPANVTMAVGSTPSVTMASTATEEITVNCADPVALGTSETECTAFWFALPPTEFPGGFTVTVSGPGGVFEKSTLNNVNIIRNHLSRMAPLEVVLSPAGTANSVVDALTADDNTPVDFQALVCATGTRAAIVTDGTYFLSVYAGTSGVSCQAGDRIRVIGTKVTYRQNPEITNPQIEVLSSGNALPDFNYQDITDSIDSFKNAYSTPVSLTGEFQSVGQGISNCVVKVSGANKNAYIYWPQEGLFDPSALNGKTVTLKGFYLFNTGSQQIDVLPVSVQEVTAPVIPNNEIWYTSTDGQVVTPDNPDVFGAAIVSNTYTDGKGTITFDGPVTQIGNSAFWQCANLKSISLPETVTDLHISAFGRCSGLEKAELPSTLKTIGQDAFEECTALTGITIPESVTSVGFYAFFECPSLSSFSGKFASGDKRCLIVNGNMIAFAPAGLGAYTVPEGVTCVYPGVFAKCQELKVLVFPENVSKVGQVYSCPNLEALVFKATTPPSIMKSTWLGTEFQLFPDTNNCPIHVPFKSINDYTQAETWSEYKNRIQQIPGSIGMMHFVPDNCPVFFDGCVVATGTRGFVVTDGVYYILVYTMSVNCSVGDDVEVDGIKVTYQGVPEISADGLVYNILSSGKGLPRLYYNDITADIDSFSYIRAVPVQLRGVYSGGYVVVEGASRSAYLYWPPSSFALSEYTGKTVLARGIYLFDYNGHPDIMLMSIGEAADPEAVDLGLSVKWATFNVGATKPEGYGNYYAWAETEPKVKYDWMTYLWCDGEYNKLTRYCSQSSYGRVDGANTLYLEDDVANANWGGSWRMPTNEEWNELIDSCDWKWTTENGVNGYRVTSKVSGYTDKSIFLPAAGEKAETSLSAVGLEGVYWSSNTVSGMSFYAYYLSFTSGGVETNGTARYFGFPVRPVCP